ncbi:MAG: penicillin-binding transpeptidase domain-containing protein [Parachlamydiales bacterium]|jgi:cell division protein FtsI/penicillin-binding protein 2
MTDTTINKKISFISKIILTIFCLISFKVWVLGVVQKEKRTKEAFNPQRRSIILKANRGIICDRNDTPLAINRIKYNATIYYSHIRELPYIKYVKDENGRKVKKYIRKEYIKKLSELLADILDLNANRIEDLIYSKASLLPHIPFVIKENISEKTYYNLRMLQKDWPGIFAEASQERFYPLNEVGGNVIGYMGRISQKEYFAIANEISYLQSLINKYENKESLDGLEKYKTIEEVKDRLTELKNLSYNNSDVIGKAAIEKVFDEKLKGFHTRKTYAVDIKGNFLKEIEGFKKPQSGSKINLCLSAKLQDFAENLLIENEKIREGQSKIYNNLKKETQIQDQPWIKGGSIVAMDPNNGEILVLASFPRFNPNDFISSSNLELKKIKEKKVNKWLETSSYIAKIYDGKEHLSKEVFSSDHKIEEKELSYDYYLELILSKDSLIKKSLDKINNLKTAIELQENVESLFYFSKADKVETLFNAIFSNNQNEDEEEILKNLQENESYLKPIENKIKDLLGIIPDNRDKIFTVDLCRMQVFNCSFSDDLIQKVGKLSLNDYWNISKAILRIKDFLKEDVRQVFHENFFSHWREENEKIFLKSKRIQENEKRQYPKPYIDLLDEYEKERFNEFWHENYAIFITFLLKENVYKQGLDKYFEHIKNLDKDPLKKDIELANSQLINLDGSSLYSFIKTIRSFDELDRPLLGRYTRVRKNKNLQLEKHLAAAFYPVEGFGYSKSYAITNSTPPGSIFKILIAYSALIEKYDDLVKNNLSLSQLNPLVIIDDFYWDTVNKKNGLIVGKTIDGRPFPRIYKNGRLPKSSHSGIGKIDLVQALEKSSNPYFSILAGDHIQNPNSLINIAENLNIGKKTGIDLLNESKGNLPKDILNNKTSLYSFAIGQHSLVATPIQIAVMMSAIANKGKVLKPKLVKSDNTIIKNTIALPDEVRNIIFEGLDRVISSAEGNSRAEAINYLRHKPKLYEEYKNKKHLFIGKTSTAEFMYKHYINPSAKAQKYKNIWFGAISFETPKDNENKRQIWEKPELVVIVELNFGSSGKEAAPLAFQVAQKFKELKEKKEL